jgi:glycyl-tRNA synthetase beta subunit
MAWVARPDWSPILDGYARCVRIIRSSSVAKGQLPAVSEKLFLEDAEKQLYGALKAVSRQPSTINEFLETVETLIPPITEFFDKVLVMAEDQAVRENRLGLLQQIAGLASGIADLSKLEGF